MGIVNAGQLAIYEQVPPELLQQVEDVLFNRHPDATERLVAYAETVKGQGQGPQRPGEDLAWRRPARGPATGARPDQGHR